MIKGTRKQEIVVGYWPLKASRPDQLTVGGSSTCYAMDDVVILGGVSCVCGGSKDVGKVDASTLRSYPR